MSKVIPFYGVSDPRMFEIERRCMDRTGAVIRRLDDLLPDGLILDVGAGDGFTAARISRRDRRVIPLEPAARMIRQGAHARRLPWVRGAAQDLPFRDGTFAGAYATWAYFFSGMAGVDTGLAALDRAVRPGGPLLFVDNAGGDDFLALAGDQSALASDAAWWAARGFTREVVQTAFRFEDIEEAHTLLGFYFGERGRTNARVEIGYNVAIYRGRGGADGDGQGRDPVRRVE